MTAYDDFLNFFSMHGKERLDGLGVDYFTAMTREEREKAFDFLWARIERAGSEESIHGLFRANHERAIEPVRRLLEAGTLSGEAQIAAAWHLWAVQPDDRLLAVFIRFMGSPDQDLREKAAYYAPAIKLTGEYKSALQRMICTETEQLARIHAVDKLLECHGISRESIGKADFSSIYKGLHSADPGTREMTLKRVDELRS
ncbi:hypothetical protein RugamoR57_04580 [Duganella caerulea]|uniref:hypothetical protein n=1 Tax=Duganella caerulea TaxID=2885762 RepID=UPI0030E9FA79